MWWWRKPRARGPNLGSPNRPCAGPLDSFALDRGISPTPADHESLREHFVFSLFVAAGPVFRGVRDPVAGASGRAAFAGEVSQSRCRDARGSEDSAPGIRECAAAQDVGNTSRGGLPAEGRARNRPHGHDPRVFTRVLTHGMGIPPNRAPPAAGAPPHAGCGTRHRRPPTAASDVSRRQTPSRREIRPRPARRSGRPTSAPVKPRAVSARPSRRSRAP